MKKTCLLLICCLMLAACAPTPSPEPTSNNPAPTEETNTQPSTTAQQPTLVQQDTAGGSTAEVPLPRQEDIIRTFFALIDEKRIPEAIGMMSPTMVPDDATKQAWGVQFNDIESIEVRDIEQTNIDLFKVSLLTKVNPRAANAPIPNYGWGDTPDIRFVQLVNNDQGQWQIDSLATGP